MLATDWANEHWKSNGVHDQATGRDDYPLDAVLQQDCLQAAAPGVWLIGKSVFYFDAVMDLPAAHYRRWLTRAVSGYVPVVQVKIQ